MVEIKCAHDAMVKICDLKPHPKNRNKHPKDQIERLSKIIEYQGWRKPVTVSNLSGFITAGHGRLEVAKALGMKEVPVDYQDYESEEQEYADVQADNAIALWADLDLRGINVDIPELGPDFDIDMLGLKHFFVDFSEKALVESSAASSSAPEEHWVDLPEFEKPEAQFRIVVYIDDEARKEEFLAIIGAKEYKQFKNTKVWSLHWPQK